MSEARLVCWYKTCEPLLVWASAAAGNASSKSRGRTITEARSRLEMSRTCISASPLADVVSQYAHNSTRSLQERIYQTGGLRTAAECKAVTNQPLQELKGI